MDKNGVIERKCCSCGEKKSRTELIKITLESKSGKIFINPDSKTFGRSLYLCPNEECFEKFIKKKLLFKWLKITPNKLEKTEYEKINAVLKSILVVKI